jgi:hypothetical protein
MELGRCMIGGGKKVHAVRVRKYYQETRYSPLCNYYAYWYSNVADVKYPGTKVTCKTCKRIMGIILREKLENGR